MSVSTALGLVSASLRNLLIGEMQLTPSVPVTIMAPDEPGGDQRINLFLYKIEENAFLKNEEWTLKPGNSNQLVQTPLSLNLFYLMTPYAKNDPQTGNTTAHEILGEAMRVFYENSIIPQNHLEPDLKTAREEFRIVYSALDPEELSRLWTTFAQPFRLSVRYQISTVQLDKAPAQEKPLPKRVRSIGVPGVEAPFRPPVVVNMAPASGPVGTPVTFTGLNLSGWRATVLVGDQTVLDQGQLSSNTFSANIPAGTEPGFYDIRVDVSHLFRRTFLFEVGP
jgi:Pvc16 N-terminal domain/IPT/TIG domain